MRELLRIFNHPEKGIFTILVGGTKGKGSTAYFLSEILRQSGLRVGFYNSPHLESPSERIWINGKHLSNEEFSEGLLQIQKRLKKVEKKSFTYFEILTLLSALLFKERKVEAAVYEVGMGGRLDATNTLPAQLILLTPIHYDHEAYLGNTLTQITREKAAILRKDCEVIVAPQTSEAMKVIRGVARRRHCPIQSPLRLNNMRLKLLGDFQRLNAAMAIRAASILHKRYHFPVTERAIRRGINSNHWPGRMEFFKGRPSILLDGAHNPKSIEVLVRNVKKLYPGKRKILIFGTSRDKRSDRMILALARAFNVCVITQSNASRSKEAASLLAEARNHFQTLVPARSSKEALALALKMAHPEDLIVGTGSFYLIGELRPLCLKLV